MKTLFYLFCAVGLVSEAFSQSTQADPQIVQAPLAIVTVAASRSATAEGTSEPASFTVKRTGPTDDSLTVFYRADGSAVDGVDYKKLPGSILIPQGAASAEIEVVSLDDEIAEAEEEVMLTLISSIRPLAASGASLFFGYQVGNPASAVLTIKDNDGAVKLPTISIAATLPEAAEEGPKNGEFTVSRFGGTDAELVVQYEIVTHSINWPDDLFLRGAEFPIFLVLAAENGTDYKTLSGSVLIPKGEKSAKILVEPVNDKLLESREHATLRLKPSAAYNVNAPDTATVFILDNDPSVAAPHVKIVEPANGSIFPFGNEIRIAAQAESSPGFVKTVEFFADGKSLGLTTNNPLSASPVNPFQLVWKEAAPGEHVLTAKAMDEAGRTTLSGPVLIQVLGSADATVVTIYASAQEASEADPNRPGIFKVLRTGTVKTKLNVHYMITGTALNGIDYDELSGTVTIPVGESSAPILIKPVPDKALEGNETVTLTLEQRFYILPPPPEEDYLVSEPKSAAVLIVENSTRGFPPKVEISQPKDGDVFAEKTSIKVEIQTADADGYVPRVELYDGDHLIDSETRNFLIKPPPGEIERFVFEWKDATAGEHKLMAKAIDDSGLSSTSNPARITVGRGSETPVVMIVTVDEEASETSPQNTAAFHVLRSGDAKTALHVYYEVGGEAENGRDYKKLPGMVTIPAGVLDARIVVVPIPDKKLEGKESVTLALVQRVFKARPGPEDDYRVGDPRTATIVISEAPSVNGPPKVAIVSPKNGAEFPFHANIEIRAEANDADGEIREVDLFANEELLVSFKTPPFKFTWRDVPAGKHLLKAKAVDDGGASGMSEPVTVVVRERLPVGFVKRDLPDIYAPGETFKVILEVSSPGDAVQVYAVEERLPKGWTLGNINEGGTFDAASHEVKFGPFLDNKPRTLTYEVTPPANESGPKEFGGVASANGVNSEIEGDHVVAPRSNRHPADIDRADDRIVIRELTAYALAWKTGKEWSIGPNPIPQSYVTRAGEIWRSGETYAYDPAQGPAPLWWVSKPSTALLTIERAKVASAVSEQPGRAMRSFGRLGQDARLVYLVTVTVLPDPGVNACTVEEHPPTGWAVSDVSDDGLFDNASGKIRWGIFLDDQARTLTYHVTRAADREYHHSVFEGVASFDGIDAPVLSGKEPGRSEGHALAKLENIHRHSTGECDVAISGGAGHRYQIQVSTNLADWIDLDLVMNETGELQVFDTDAKDAPVRYYRAILSD